MTGRRHDLLDRCLASLSAQDPGTEFELVVVADADPASEPVVRRHFPNAVVEHVPKSTPAAGRNRMLGLARGDLLLFLDDDVLCEPLLLSSLEQLASAHPDAVVFGGPNETPPGSARFQDVQGAVLASMVTSGPVRRRYGRHPAGYVDDTALTLCNMAVRRSAMIPFDGSLVCAEENALLATLRRSGGRFFYHPDLAVYHERRPTPASFARQMMKYGRGRGQLLVRDPSTFRPVYAAAPAILAAWLILPIVAAFAGPAALAPLGLYLLFAFASSVKIAVSLHNPPAAPPALLMTVIVHACYGAGVLAGILRPGTRTSESELSVATASE